MNRVKEGITSNVVKIIRTERERELHDEPVPSLSSSPCAIREYEYTRGMVTRNVSYVTGLRSEASNRFNCNGIAIRIAGYGIANYFRKALLRLM